MHPRNTLLALFALLVVISNLPASAQLGTGEFIQKTINHDGYTRAYNLYVPSAYDRTQEWPLVISFHGFSWGIHTTGEASQPRLDNLSAVADTAHFLIAYPLGLSITIGLPQGIRTNTGWNFDFARGAWDDVAFTSAAIDHIYADYAVDLNRVHVTGMSTGSEMAFTVACRLADRIASIGGVAGPMVESFFGRPCTTYRPVSILLMHGTDDQWFPFTGYPYDDYAPRPVAETPSFWARHNFCSTDSLVTELPDVDTADNSTVTRIEYPDCEADTEVLFYRVNDGGHTWPGSPYRVPVLGTHNMDINASAIIWGFFKRNPHPNPRPAFEPRNTTLVGHWPIGGDLFNVEANDDIALVSSWGGYGSGKVWWLDTSDPAHPSASVLFDHGLLPWTMTLNGDIAYTTGDVFDIGDPVNPVHLSEFSGPAQGGFGSIAVNDSLAFLVWLGEGTSTDGGLQIFDVSDPAHPAEVSFLEMTFITEVRNMAVLGDYVYLTSPTNAGGLHIVDVSDPTHPALTTFDARWGGVWGLAVKDSLLFLGASDDDYPWKPDSTLIILDISNPAIPEQVAEVPVALRDVVVFGDFLYVATELDGLRIFDISDPAHPQEAGFFATPGEAQAIAVSGDYVYVAGEGGVYIISHDPAKGTPIEEGPPTDISGAFHLRQNYPNPLNTTTTISYDLPRLSEATLTVFDVLGRTIRELASGTKPAGTHQVSFDASGLPSGVYFYRLHAGDFVETRSLLLLR